MNIKEIVRQYLVQHTYDGLYNDECWCTINDLMSCDGCKDDCMPGCFIDKKDWDKYPGCIGAKA